MRDCYKKFWKTALVEKMQGHLPMFELKESASRKAADAAAPSSRPVTFFWKPIDKLVFTIEFRACGEQDEFEASCRWSETGGANVDVAWPDRPFEESIFATSSVVASFQSISRACGDNPQVFCWAFWSPATEPGPSHENYASFKAEFIAEELRRIPDHEARERVDAAVGQTMADLIRCAMPWFEKKLTWYQAHDPSR